MAAGVHSVAVAGTGLSAAAVHPASAASESNAGARRANIMDFLSGKRLAEARLILPDCKRLAIVRLAVAAPKGRRGEDMDAIDRQIVAMLRGNARLPLKTIAATVGLARSSVRERLSKLEAAGTIGGYHARIVDQGGIAAILQLRLARTPSPDIVAAVTGMAEVARCYSLSGEIDLLVEIEAVDAAGLNAARDRIALIAGVEDTTTALILKRDKDR
jgi:DNA-binding Lrp family transcriptional regulator